MSGAHDPRLDGELPPIDRRRLLAALREVLPDGAVLDSDETMAPFECDGLSAYRQRPAAVVLPENTAQVRALLRRMSDIGVPVVTRERAPGSPAGRCRWPRPCCWS